MSLVVFAIFGGALTLTVYAMFATIAPQMGRIAQALRGEPQLRFAPLATLARAERRIAVRRWAATSSRPAPWSAAA